MCDELKPFEFTTPGWYRFREVVAWVCGVSRNAREAAYDSPTVGICVSLAKNFHGPCLGTDPEHTPKPLVMRAMCWYVAGMVSSWGEFTALVANRARNGQWTVLVNHSDGTSADTFRCGDNGESTGGTYRIIREHTGPLPWEAT